MARAPKTPDLVDALPWGVKEQLTLEKPAVGFYLSGHLFDEVATEVRRFVQAARLTT
jgi:DNA polymerase-3 subunit alpha